jgi:hypothetical protein
VGDRSVEAPLDDVAGGLEPGGEFVDVDHRDWSFSRIRRASEMATARWKC